MGWTPTLVDHYDAPQDVAGIVGGGAGPNLI